MGWSGIAGVSDGGPAYVPEDPYTRRQVFCIAVFFANLRQLSKCCTAGTLHLATLDLVTADA
jgi:hypothetical protein